MRYLLIFVPMALGCLLLLSQGRDVIGWLLIGIGVFFFVAQQTNLFAPAKPGQSKFDWFTSSVLLFFAVYFFKEYQTSNQHSDLLAAIGSTFVVLSTMGILIERFVAKKITESPATQEYESIVIAKFQTVVRSLGEESCCHHCWFVFCNMRRVN